MRQIVRGEARKRGGAFQFNTTNNIDRQINCNFTVTATGNAASPTHAGAGIAPVGMQGSGLNATTTGNQAQADNSASGVNSNVTGSITPDRANASPVSVGGDLSVGATGRGGFPTLAELARTTVEPRSLRSSMKCRAPSKGSASSMNSSRRAAMRPWRA